MILNHCVDQMQALQNMYEYLLDAEIQMGTVKVNNAVSYAVESGESVPVAAGAGDTNICGGIVQLYWDNILGRCLDVNDQIRQIALKVRMTVSIILRQNRKYLLLKIQSSMVDDRKKKQGNAKMIILLKANKSV